MDIYDLIGGFFTGIIEVFLTIYVYYWGSIVLPIISFFAFLLLGKKFKERKIIKYNILFHILFFCSCVLLYFSLYPGELAGFIDSSEVLAVSIMVNVASIVMLIKLIICLIKTIKKRKNKDVVTDIKEDLNL